jgi:hypothetical protein
MNTIDSNNEYTLEDLMILNSMVDGIKDNFDTTHPWRTFPDEQGIGRLFSNDESIGNYTSDFILKIFIKFLSPYHGKSTIIPRIAKLINEEPLENVPLYLNDGSNNHRIVARWRLQIGK